MEITHLFSPSATGGLERVVEMLAVGQARRGHPVTAFAIQATDTKAPVLARLADAGVSVHVVRAAGRAYGVERRRLETELRGVRPGLLHTHGYRADILHAPTAKRLGFSVVTTLHGFTGGDWKMRLYERLQRRACRRIDRVVAVSRPIADLMRRSGVSDAALRLIPNAYASPGTILSRDAARARLNISGDGFVIGYAGRLSLEKGVDVLLAALARLKDLPIMFACIGDGAEDARLRQLASDIGVADRVRWIPPVDNVALLFRAFDVFALGSRTEGTPIVLFEAMAAAVPIVCTAVGGVPDVLSQREATLVPAEAPPALADAIRAIFHDASPARERARVARAVLDDRYAPDPWLARYDDVYAEALGSGARAT